MRVWVGFREMGRIFVGCGLGEGFFEGIWGGEVWYGLWRGRGVVVRNGFRVGFWGDVAIRKYSGLVHRFTKSF